MRNRFAAVGPLLCIAALLVFAAMARPGGASAGEAPPFTVRVVEMARTVDLARGRDWLVATVEITPRVADRAGLRQVQPLREHLTLVDDQGTEHRCAWLRGGTALDNPTALRLQAGFPVPAAAARKVSLTILLPVGRPPETVELTLKRAELARLPATVATPRGPITVEGAEEQPYTPPAVPEDGRFFEKGPPADGRLFQRPLRPGEKQPERALLVTWRTPSVTLFDRALDIDAAAQGVDGKSYPLLTALLRRTPSRTVTDAPGTPSLTGRYWFRTPPKNLLAGLTLTFTLRAGEKEHEPVRIDNLPIPGKG